MIESERQIKRDCEMNNECEILEKLRERGKRDCEFQSHNNIIIIIYKDVKKKIKL